MQKILNIEKGPFKADWESLRNFECPEWFKDAKLGIWAHWGAQAVPMYGDWYARNMYIEGHDQYYHHWRTYGHPSQHGWKDIVKTWKAENFDPDTLMDLYVKAGAHYFCALAVHHDNFDNWDSTFNKWNSVNMGPKKDIIGEFQRSAKKYNLPFGVTEHLAASFSWWSWNKNADKEGPYKGIPYDGNDPNYKDFYHSNRDEPKLTIDNVEKRWYTDNLEWQNHWFDRIKDLIDKYKPDLLYSDGPLPFETLGLGIVAHLYNTSINQNKGINKAVYTQKDANPLVHKIGVLDIERGVKKGTSPYPWQTDTCIGNWFYDVRQRYKSVKQVIQMLVDTVSKNGNLLLSVPLKPDGTLDDECVYILQKMAEWIKINGEGIFETRPWEISSEGPTLVKEGEFQEEEVNYTPFDYRFTQKGKYIYAFQLGWPESGETNIKSFSAGRGITKFKVVDVENIELLGYDGKLEFEQNQEGLKIKKLPFESPIDFVHCFKITIK